jgi:formyltetrahydrofolate deformylase
LRDGCRDEQDELGLIISNHQNACSLAQYYGISFYHLPVIAETKAEVQARQLELLTGHSADLIVRAGYMQVLSPAFVANYPLRIINVHHSFLPAFTGAKPYDAAFARGVKLIGSTNHYVTEVLEGRPNN